LVQRFPSRSDRLVTIRDDALERILSDYWPWNVRERKNVAPRAMVPPGGVLAPDCIQFNQGASGAPVSWLEQMSYREGYWNVI
jgi:DNA-binding NtrC family response regulator